MEVQLRVPKDILDGCPSNKVHREMWWLKGTHIQLWFFNKGGSIQNHAPRYSRVNCMDLLIWVGHQSHLGTIGPSHHRNSGWAVRGGIEEQEPGMGVGEEVGCVHGVHGYPIWEPSPRLFPCLVKIIQNYESKGGLYQEVSGSKNRTVCTKPPEVHQGGVILIQRP